MKHLDTLGKQMVKESTVHPYDGMVLSNTFVTQNLDEPGCHAEWKA